MKTLLKSMAFLAMAAVSFSACTKDISQNGNMKEMKLSVNAVAEDLSTASDTKTYIDGSNNVLWGENEQMTIVVMDGTNNTFANSASTSDYSGQARATFSFEFTVPESASYTYGGIYPSSAVVTGSNNNPLSYKITLPDGQNAASDSYDPAAYILVARPETADAAKTEWTAYYRRATALNRITLTGLTEDISAVEITVPEGKYIAGRRYFDLSTGKSGEIYSGGGRTNKIRVNYAVPLTGGTDMDIWFTSWGAEVAAGETVTIKAVSASKSYARTITAREEGIKFIEGKLNMLQVAMDAGDVLVEDLADFSGQYLIGGFSAGKWALMSNDCSTGINYAEVSTSINKEISQITCTDFYDIPGLENYVWTVEKHDGGYAIKNAADNKYVYYNGEKSISGKDEPYILTISSESDGTHKILFTGNYELRYNNSAKYFTAYGGTVNPVVLIPWIPDTAPRIFVTETSKTVASDAAEATFEYTTRNIAGEIAAAVTSDTDNMVSAVSCAGGTVTVSLNPNTEEREKTAAVTLSYEGAESVVLTVVQRAFIPAGSEKYYVKVTEEPADWSGTYLIVFESMNRIYKGSLTSDFGGTSSSACYYDVEIDSGKILSDDEIDSNHVVIENNSGNYALKTASGYYIYNSDTSAKMESSDTYSEACNVTIAFNEGNVLIYGTGGCVLLYNSSSHYIRFYKSSNIASYPNPSLYKLQ